MNTLAITIDAGGLQTMSAAGQQIVLASPGAGEAGLPIAWLACPPAQSTTVTWTGTYQVYASLSPLTVGVPVQMSFYAPAIEGMKYTLGTGGFTSAPDGTEGSYEIVNAFAGPSAIVGGLARQSDVDGNTLWSPLSSCVIPHCQNGFLRGSESLLVFPASGMATGDALDPGWLSGDAGGNGVVVGVPLSLDFSAGPTQAIRYDDNQNRFVPAS